MKKVMIEKNKYFLLLPFILQNGTRLHYRHFHEPFHYVNISFCTTVRRRAHVYASVVHALPWKGCPGYLPPRTETRWSCVSSRSCSVWWWDCTAEAVLPPPGATACRRAPLPCSLCAIPTTTKPERHRTAAQARSGGILLKVELRKWNACGVRGRRTQRQVRSTGSITSAVNPVAMSLI